MRIVKLDAIDSTNTYLKGLMQSETLEDFTVVTANHQQYGRGQMGSKWKSEPGLNLIMSVLKRFDSFQAQEQFFLVVWVSLAVLDALKSFEIPNLSIKWPNDIMSGNRKIGGILIENSLKGPKIQSAVIGVGLNVNQSEFVDLPNATSMKLCFGRDYEINEVLEAVLRNLQQGFITYEKEGPVTPWTLYEEHLFGKDRECKFLIDGDRMVYGKIRGVSAEGKLQIALENGVLRTFGLKEIKLLL
ncbi:MAG: biotin--[acetyl-CoA-carboxylase] ligase [Flavobacteriaceae bacterium]